MATVKDDEYFNFILERMQVVGPVKGRKMFGGYGLFLDGVMFALIAYDDLYFKADKETIPVFEENDLGPFIYSKDGKDVKMSYYRAPDESVEDDEVMIQWATMAHETATRAAARKKKK